jgi:glycosyltransferase involved in cell wall biosynthesis
VDSLLAQTYPDMELILVDDGSPDRCGAICDEYKLIHSDRMKVIHKKNGGVAEARNAGIEAANGSYLAFVDPDDFVHPRMLEILYENLKAADADISVCAYKQVNDGINVSETAVRQMENLTTMYSGEQALWNLYDKKLKAITVVVWGKLYKTEMFKDIRFSVGRNLEDAGIIHQLLYRSQAVVYTELAMYFYYVRHGSIMSMPVENFRYVLMNFEDRTMFFQQKGLNYLLELECKKHLHDIITYYVRTSYSSPNERDALEGMKERFRTEYRQMKKNGTVMLARCTLFFHAPKVYYFLWKYLWRMIYKYKHKVELR